MATVATVGQRTLEISPQKAPAGAMAVVVVRSKTTGKAVKYIVPESWISRLIEINRKFDPAGRYDEVMKAENLFELGPQPWKTTLRRGLLALGSASGASLAAGKHVRVRPWTSPECRSANASAKRSGAADEGVDGKAIAFDHPDSAVGEAHIMAALEWLLAQHVRIRRSRHIMVKNRRADFWPDLDAAAYSITWLVVASIVSGILDPEGFGDFVVDKASSNSDGRYSRRIG
jgi:hypothetical protein